MRYTIEDLRNGKCAVKNDGTLEELNKVLKEAFGWVRGVLGNFDYYFLDAGATWSVDCLWDFSMKTNLPTQSARDFLLSEEEMVVMPEYVEDIILFAWHNVQRFLPSDEHDKDRFELELEGGATRYGYWWAEREAFVTVDGDFIDDVIYWRKKM